MNATVFASIPGPLRSALILAGFVCIAIFVALIAHRALIAVLRRLAHNRPFTTDITHFAYNASRACIVLSGVRMVLTGAPENTPFITQLSYITTILLILALTWLAMSCVASIGSTVIRLNPADVVDNLKARRLLTQTRVLTRSAHFVIGLLGLAFVLLTLPGARQFGASLLASAGVAGLVAGIAARPVLGNFIAGLQIAFSQPIRIDDVLIVQDQWGRVEEITGTYVVVKIWDERRMIVPLQWFVENPFENWTHNSSTILGTVFLWMDFSVPLDALRTEFERITRSAEQWDGRVCVLQVTDSNERAAQLRLLVSAQDAGRAFDLRCIIREGMISYIARHYPGALPRLRSSIDMTAATDLNSSTTANMSPDPAGSTRKESSSSEAPIARPSSPAA